MRKEKKEEERNLERETHTHTERPCAPERPREKMAQRLIQEQTSLEEDGGGGQWPSGQSWQLFTQSSSTSLDA